LLLLSLHGVLTSLNCEGERLENVSVETYEVALHAVNQF